MFGNVPVALPKAGAPSAGVVAAYGVFLGAAGLVYHFIAEGEFSVLLTLSVIVQCLSLALLLQTFLRGSAGGISAQSLVMAAISLGCRLASTLTHDGYLPVDASGDFVYQAFDLCSLGIVLFLLRKMLVTRELPYNSTEDTFDIQKWVIGAAGTACILHAGNNHNHLFDTLWFIGLYVDTVAMLPQLWLIAKTGGRVEPILSHYIATTVGSRILAAIFWYHAAEDVVYHPWITGVQTGGYLILFAYAAHFVLLADFVYYYMRTSLSSGLVGMSGSSGDMVCCAV